MKEKYCKIPKFRFNKFLESWERLKYEDVIEVNSGKDYKHLDKGDIPVYGTGGYMLSVSEAITDKDGVGIGRKGTINKPYILKAPYWTVDTLFFCIPKNKYNLYFINAIFERTQWERFDESTGVPSLSKLTINNIQNYFPSFNEQSAIGSLFRTLDDLLSSYKENLANYQSLKAPMLSKMFPKAGQTLPEIRLDGFDDEWEVLQLSDICQKVTEKNKDNKFNETFTNSAEFGIINQRDFFEKDISNEKSLNTYYVVRNNDFVYNPRISNYAPVGPIKRNKLGRTGVMSPLYFVFRIINSNIDLNFLETFFDTNTWHKFMKLNGDSGARADRFAIKDSVFLTMPIAFPSLPEQQAIGSYFSNLDNLISAHKEKISQLETLKKKLLQDMFV